MVGDRDRTRAPFSESLNHTCSIQLFTYDLMVSAFLLLWHRPALFSLLPRMNPLLSPSPHSPESHWLQNMEKDCSCWVKFPHWVNHLFASIKGSIILQLSWVKCVSYQILYFWDMKKTPSRATNVFGIVH